MHGPLTAAGIMTAGSAGVTFATLFPEATPAVMICALAGAMLYVLSSENHQIWKQVIYACISFIGGVYCSQPVSEIISGLLNMALNHLQPPVTVAVSPAVGALVASAITVTILLRLLAKSRTVSLEELFRTIKSKITFWKKEGGK
ncbi:putative holin [Entomohabitans teleogrylli]|uniref:putative holin n=1 Tax=Entomohabitans teleogrylli TaxID=1384589 RepID=UPI0008FC596D|nr:putative holin [Entomohabitans teleogrylli]